MAEDGNVPEEPGSLARRSIVGVRAFHAMMRARLTPTGWPNERFGKPINQEDLLGTMLAFVVPVFESLERMGVGVTCEEREAYTRTWCAIGYLLGIEHSLLVREDGAGVHLLTYAEATELSAVIRWRQHQRNLVGTWLLDELLDDVSNYFPIGFGAAPDVLLRIVGDDRVADLLLAERRRSDLVARTISAVVTVLRSPVGMRLQPGLLQITKRLFLKEFFSHDFPPNFDDPTVPPPAAVPDAVALGCLAE